MSEDLNCLRDKMHTGVRMFVEEMERMAREPNLSLSDMMDLSDMMKDMSEVLKNLAKAHHYMP